MDISPWPVAHTPKSKDVNSFAQNRVPLDSFQLFKHKHQYILLQAMLRACLIDLNRKVCLVFVKLLHHVNPQNGNHKLEPIILA